MPTVQKDFDAYMIWYYSGHTYEALIYCYKAGAYVGRIVFYKDGSVQPNANFASGPSVHYSLSRFEHVVDILRNEKPLYLFLNLDNLIGMVATSEQEPTGEEE